MDHRGDSVVLDYRGEAISDLNREVLSVLEATLNLIRLYDSGEQFAFWQDADRFRIE